MGGIAMHPELTEHSHQAEAGDRDWISAFGFIGRFTVAHTAAYFIAGLIFSTVMNYRGLFATAEYSFMRPFDHPLVMLGPSLQIFRGAILALTFLPFRKAIVGSRRGWLYLFVALWILTNVGANAADPGTIEAFIYTDYAAAIHFATWPESIFSSLASAWLFHTWQRNPSDRRLSIPLIGVVVIAVVAAVLGLLFTPSA
jgi:hypothetical protein